MREELRDPSLLDATPAFCLPHLSRLVEQVPPDLPANGGIAFEEPADDTVVHPATHLLPVGRVALIA